MTTDNLARIQRVSLREEWPDESRDFTPWLARNIGELGAALGVELELQEEESAVGSRSLDIFATDLTDGRPVIIENQLEPTDNDHLSRLLIYAAGKDAKMVIWVASAIDDEHRQVLDWLNQRAGENTQFYGVALELLRIDDSRLAPLFSVMAAPKGWRKPGMAVKAAEYPPPSAADRHGVNRQFRWKLEERLRREHNYSVFPNAPNGSRGWCVFEGRDADFQFVTGWWGNNPRIEFIIEKNGGGPQSWEWNRRAFEQLEQWREVIDAEILDSTQGERSDWQIQRSGRVWVSRPGNIYEHPERWDEYHDWIIAKFFKFREVFTPLLGELSAAGETE